MRLLSWSIARRPGGVRGHVGVFIACTTILMLMCFVPWSKHMNRGRTLDSLASESSEDADPVPSAASHRETAIKRMWGLEAFDTWPDYFDKFDPSRLAPFTKEVQRWIYEKLHPPVESCAAQKYYILGTHIGGIGSIMHVASFKLAVALEHGYLVVWHPQLYGAGGGFADPGCGRGEQHSNFLCYFEPPSSCGFEFVTPSNSVAALNWSDANFGMERYDIPSHWAAQLRAGFSELGLTQSYLKFWWRAQGAAYLMRLQSQAGARLLSMRLGRQRDTVVGYDVSRRAPLDVPFPLPPGTTSIHVRHGDKGREMTLMPLSGYLRKLEHLASENPLHYKKALFLSSEDPTVIDEARRAKNTLWGGVPHENWVVWHTNITRTDSSVFDQLERFGKSERMHVYLLELLMALECDAFVGTLGSNWNRLIAELRCVWIDSCNAPYFEVGPREDWAEYRW